MSLTSILRWSFTNRRTLGAEHTIGVGSARTVLQVPPHERNYDWIEAEIVSTTELGALVREMAKDPAWATMPGLTVGLVWSAALNVERTREIVEASGVSARPENIQLRPGVKIFVPVPQLIVLAPVLVAPSTPANLARATVMLDPSWLWQLVQFYLVPLKSMTRDLRAISDLIDEDFAEVVAHLGRIGVQENILDAIIRHHAAGGSGISDDDHDKMVGIRNSATGLGRTASSYFTNHIMWSRRMELARREGLAATMLLLIDSQDEGATSGFCTLLKLLWSTPNQDILLEGARTPVRSLAATVLHYAFTELSRVPDKESEMLARITSALDAMPTSSGRASTSEDVLVATIERFEPSTALTWLSTALTNGPKSVGNLPGPESLAGALLKASMVMMTNEPTPAKAGRWMGWLRTLVGMHGNGLQNVTVPGTLRTMNVLQELDDIEWLFRAMGRGHTQAQFENAMSKMEEIGATLGSHYQAEAGWKRALGLVALVTFAVNGYQAREAWNKRRWLDMSVAVGGMISSGLTAVVAFRQFSAATSAKLDRRLKIVGGITSFLAICAAIADGEQDYRVYLQNLADLVALSGNPFIAAVGLTFSIGISVWRALDPPVDTLQPAVSRTLTAQLDPLRTVVLQGVRARLGAEVLVPAPGGVATISPRQLARDRDERARRQRAQGIAPPHDAANAADTAELVAFWTALEAHVELIKQGEIQALPRRALGPLEAAGFSSQLLQSLTITPFEAASARQCATPLL